jgi:hypothetical protein
MGRYIYTEKFTLIPKEAYTPQLGREALEQQFHIGAEDHIDTCDVCEADAVAVYCAPGAGCNTSDMDKPLPLAAGMMQVVCGAEEFNKAAFHYSREKGFAHIIIYAGKELKLANAFKVDSYESALYFLFLSIQQLQMNPKQCIVRVCFQATIEQQQIMDKFFNGVEIHNLSNTIFTI